MLDDRNLYGTATGLDQRGRHASFGSALGAAVSEVRGLLAERNDFFDSLADRWDALFPTLPARPGRYEDGKIFVYVRSAPLLFATRPKLRQIARTLAGLPGAPKKIDLRLEIHAQ